MTREERIKGQHAAFEVLWLSQYKPELLAEQLRARAAIRREQEHREQSLQVIEDWRTGRVP